MTTGLQVGICAREVVTDDIQHGGEPVLALTLQLLRQFEQFRSVGPEILRLIGELPQTLFGLVVLLDGAHVDIAQVGHLAIQCPDTRLRLLHRGQHSITFRWCHLEFGHLIGEFLE